MFQCVMADKSHDILIKRKTKSKNQEMSQEVLTFLGSSFIALKRAKRVIISITLKKYTIKNHNFS